MLRFPCVSAPYVAYTSSCTQSLRPGMTAVLVALARLIYTQRHCCTQRSYALFLSGAWVGECICAFRLSCGHTMVARLHARASATQARGCYHCQWRLSSASLSVFHHLWGWQERVVAWAACMLVNPLLGQQCVAWLCGRVSSGPSCWGEWGQRVACKRGEWIQHVACKRQAPQAAEYTGAGVWIVLGKGCVQACGAL
jgi:hypothetical protein